MVKVHQTPKFLIDVAEEILRQLPNQQGISPASLAEMQRFYKAKKQVLTRFGEKTL